MQEYKSFCGGVGARSCFIFLIFDFAFFAWTSLPYGLPYKRLKYCDKIRCSPSAGWKETSRVKSQKSKHSSYLIEQELDQLVRTIS